ncbi:MAG: phenylalanine--tRNA ligase subunit alpha [Verrucomicrobiota bacterium]
MVNQMQSLREEALELLKASDSSAKLEEWRIKYLSRQGKLPTLLEQLKNVPKEEKPVVGKLANEIKQALVEAFEEQKATLSIESFSEDVDLTMPGRPFPQGNLHPITATMERIVEIFRRMGFALADGPDIETEYHNFDALNTPPDHPARNEQDTFYFGLPPHPQYGRWLLRTQTSTVQIRTMQKQKPPIQIIAPGRCYRRDEVDATHGMYFHQVEGLFVDENVHVGHLVGTLEFFFKELLGPDTKVRFRPHFFPFTEPSFEVDFSQPGIKMRGKEWLEICGCGMVDPAVLSGVGIDPEKYTGYAFGMGVERIAMILHEIPDLRLFSENDLRFLKQFA